jgi:hypothetical protein
MDASRNEGDEAVTLWHSRCSFTKAAFATDTSEVNMANGIKRNWRELCLAVTNESDSTKFSSLVQELTEALDGANDAGVTAFVSKPKATKTLEGNAEAVWRGTYAS